MVRWRAGRIAILFGMQLLLGAYRNASEVAASIEAEYLGCDNFDFDKQFSFSRGYVFTYRQFLPGVPQYKEWSGRVADLQGLSADGSRLVCREPGCIGLTEQNAKPVVGDDNQLHYETSQIHHVRSQLALPPCGVEVDTYMRLKTYWKELIDDLAR